jgi:hypothetical protein
MGMVLLFRLIAAVQAKWMVREKKGQTPPPVMRPSGRHLPRLVSLPTGNLCALSAFSLMADSAVVLFGGSADPGPVFRLPCENVLAHIFFHVHLRSVDTALCRLDQPMLKCDRTGPAK